MRIPPPAAAAERPAGRFRRPILLATGVLVVCAVGMAGLLLSGARAGAGGRAKPAAARPGGPVLTWRVDGVDHSAWLALDKAAVVTPPAQGDDGLRVVRLGASADDKAALRGQLKRLQSAAGGTDQDSPPVSGASGATAGETVGAVLYRGAEKAEERLVTVGDVIVAFEPGTPGAARSGLAARLGLRRLQSFSFSPDTVLYRSATPLDVFSALASLNASDLVAWAEPSFLRTQSRRTLPDDPLFTTQWHLRNIGQRGAKLGEDVNVASVWDETVAGLPLRGSHTDGFGDDEQVIAIADDGLEIGHPDLAPNVIAGRSYDWADGNTDPSPSRTWDDQEWHGTACAGLAAGRGFNGAGITGSAPWAGLIGYRFLLDGVDSDVTESEALAAVKPADGLNRDLVDVSSNSWGPEDDGHLEAPGPLTEAALLDGVTNGRGGKGIVYVWAAGNGRADGDNVNYDGYANSRYTLAVGASTALGKIAPYSEDGAPLRVVAPSSDGTADILRDVTTTDLTGSAGYVDGDYYSGFGGTSASAPIASGVVALILQANPLLTWRDVQAIVTTTAAKIDTSHPDWTTNAAGYRVNHTYGFGRLNAAAAVAAARTWQPLGPETVLESSVSPGVSIPDASSAGGSSRIALGAGQPRLRLEYVEVVIDAPHAYWRDLDVRLVAPSGTESILAVSSTPSRQVGGQTLEGWRFGSARHFGESSRGTWRLVVRDLHAGDVGHLQSWTLRLYGTPLPDDTEPPVTSVSPARSWWNRPVKLKLRAVDVGSNVARTESRLAAKADGPFSAGTRVALPVARASHVDDGRTYLWFRSTDNSGNVEPTKRFVINIDTRPPATRMLGAVIVRRGRSAKLQCRVIDRGFSAHSAHVRFQISRAGKVVRTIDAGVRSTKSPVVRRFVCDLPKGTYTVRALARDLAGNTQSAAGRASFTVR
jgi:kexin